MNIQIVLLILGGGHFWPESECCHIKHKKEHCCCESENDVVQKCELIPANETFSSCTCPKNEFGKTVDFKIEQIKTVEKIQFITSINEELTSGNKDYKRISENKKYFVPPLHIFIKNSSFLI